MLYYDLYLENGDNEVIKNFIRQKKFSLVEKKVKEWFEKTYPESPPAPEGGVAPPNPPQKGGLKNPLLGVKVSAPPSGAGGLEVQLIYQQRQAAFRLRDFWFYQLENLAHKPEECRAACQTILAQKAIIRKCWALLAYYDKFKKLPEVEPPITIYYDEAAKQQRIRSLTANIARDRKDGKLDKVEKWEKELYLIS